MKKLKKILAISILLGVISNGNTLISATEGTIQETQASTSTTENSTDLTQKYNELMAKNEKLNEKNISLKNEISELKAENEELQETAEKCYNKMKKYKKKLKEKEQYISPEEMQNETERIRAKMILEFTSYLGEYIKSNSSKKIKTIDMRGFLSKFLTVNVNYTNKGNTTFSGVTAKGTAAGAAITT